MLNRAFAGHPRPRVVGHLSQRQYVSGHRSSQLIMPRQGRYANDRSGPLARKFEAPSPELRAAQALRYQFVGRIVMTEATAGPSLRGRLQMHLPAVAVGMACLLFGLGLLVDVQTLQANHSAKAQVAALSARADAGNGDGSVPSETKPTNIGNYQVAPDLPKFLKIAKFGVDARIMPLGVTTHNALQSPTNIYDTGWYEGSARPGDPAGNGAIVIDGHVHGPTKPGVFVNLTKLQPGDTIQIIRGDNKVFNYSVVKVQNYNAANLNMAPVLASIKPGQAGLNLITCGGPFNTKIGQYTQRTIVFTVAQ